MAEFDNDKSIYNDSEDEITPDENGNFLWQCFVCGAIFEQPEKPEYCPLCKKEETFFFKVKPQDK